MCVCVRARELFRNFLSFGGTKYAEGGLEQTEEETPVGKITGYSTHTSVQAHCQDWNISLIVEAEGGKCTEDKKSSSVLDTFPYFTHSYIFR